MSDHKTKFSFIVPCYNVRKFLPECVNSILSQSFTNFEVILVDDGATDGTGKLCDDYCKKDYRIHCVHKCNGGLSDARNYGIKIAVGEYLIFVDSDDFIAPNFLEKLCDCLTGNPEVILSTLTEYHPNGMCIQKDKDSISKLSNFPNRYQAVCWLMMHSQNPWPAPKNILARSFVNKYNLQFKKGYLHEDLDWTIRMCFFAQTFGVYKDEWYYHRMEREGSITNTYSSKHIIDVLKMSEELIASQELKTQEPKIKSAIIGNIMDAVYPKINEYKFLKPDEKEKVILYLKGHKSILKYAHKVKYKIFRLAVKVFGVRVSLNLLQFVS